MEIGGGAQSVNVNGMVTSGHNSKQNPIAAACRLCTVSQKTPQPTVGGRENRKKSVEEGQNSNFIILSVSLHA